MNIKIKDEINELIRKLRIAEFMDGVTNKPKYRGQAKELYEQILDLLYK